MGLFETLKSIVDEADKPQLDTAKGKAKPQDDVKPAETKISDMPKQNKNKSK